MLFDDLVRAELEDALKPEVEKLLILKRTASEIGITPRIQIFNDYIDKTMPEIKEIAEGIFEEKQKWEPLDGAFLMMIG